MIRAAVAQGWGSATAKACNQPFPDCTRCRRPGSQELRASWGCDAPASRSVWESGCPRCGGADSECARCGGKGVASHRRCPEAIIREAPRSTQAVIELLIRAYSHYDRRNVLPAPGGWLDQTKSFILCVDLIDAERGYWEGLLNEHHDRERQRAEAKSRGGAGVRRGR